MLEIDPDPTIDVLVTKKSLKAALGDASDSTIWHAIQRKKLPPPRYLAGRACWLRSEVIEFISSLPVADGSHRMAEIAKKRGRDVQARKAASQGGTTAA